ncbi:MAG: accessory factor UbiK family protein [Alphaproteobacteria bacterium]|nr:accessory factor UbiK family protein [Alphaproteobacteria bacterium]
MQTENRFFDDLARLAGGAMGAVAGLRAEFESLMRQQVDRMIAGMDLVRREEFDAVQAMAAKARLEQEALAKRVAVLEANLDRSRRETTDGS